MIYIRALFSEVSVSFNELHFPASFAVVLVALQLTLSILYDYALHFKNVRTGRGTKVGTDTILFLSGNVHIFAYRILECVMEINSLQIKLLCKVPAPVFVHTIPAVFRHEFSNSSEVLVSQAWTDFLLKETRRTLIITFVNWHYTLNSVQ